MNPRADVKRKASRGIQPTRTVPNEEDRGTAVELEFEQDAKHEPENKWGF